MKKQYALSTESRKTSQEFGYATKAASSLLKALKLLVREKNTRLLYNSLCSTLIKVINTSNIERKGKRTLIDGDLSLLRGFKLNHYLFLSSICDFSPGVYFSAEEKYVEILTPPLSKGNFNVPPRATAVSVTFRCILLDPDTLETEIMDVKVLEISLKDGIGAKKVKIAIDNAEHKIVLLAMGAYLHLKDINGDQRFISHNRNHIAGAIIDAVYMKDGQIVPFIATEPPVKSVIPSPENPNTFSWEDA